MVLPNRCHLSSECVLLRSGTFLVIASTAACVIGLTWSGVQYSWTSAPVLVPLIAGLVGLAVFIAYEGIIPEHPLVRYETVCSSREPVKLMRSRCLPCCYRH